MMLPAESKIFTKRNPIMERIITYRIRESEEGLRTEQYLRRKG